MTIKAPATSSSSTAKLVEVKVSPGVALESLDQQLAQGTIEGYSRDGDTLKVMVNDRTDLASLKQFTGRPAPNSIARKVASVLIPENMDEVCAPEYLQLRAWQVAGGVLGGALNFCAAATLFQSQAASFPNGAGLALAGAYNSWMGLAANTAASITVARYGDLDPRRIALYAGLWSTANTFAQISGAAFYPAQNLPLSLGLTVSGAFSGNLGGSAGTHIANHLVVEHARGAVGAINGNQDRWAALLGTPLGLGVQWAVGRMGFDPTLGSLVVLGGALLLCNIQQFNVMRFESADRAEMESLATSLLEGREPEAVPPSGFLGALREAFWPEPDQEGRIEHLQDAAPLLQEERIRTLAAEDYLLGMPAANGTVQLVFRKNSGANSLIRGIANAVLREKCEPLRAAAEQLAPGRADLLLTELSYRAMPGGSTWKDQLSLAGWHIHPSKLQVGTDDQWRGKPTQVNAIPAQVLEELIANPAPEALRSALEGSPLLSPSA